ncbi:MAG: hypothetical protein NVS2B4_03110 [Ramlibacter sp.]
MKRHGAAQMVGRHQAHGGRRQDAHAIQLVAGEHGLAKAQVIARGAHPAGTAGIVAGCAADVNHLAGRAGGRIDREGLRQPCALAGGDRETGVGHLDRAKQALLHEVAQSAAGDGLHHPPLHVH